MQNIGETSATGGLVDLQTPSTRIPRRRDPALCRTADNLGLFMHRYGRVGRRKQDERYGALAHTSGEERRLGRRYLLDERVGHGAMGAVWRGRDLDTGATVAIKLLAEALTQDPDILARFVQERTVLLGLRHPNLVSIHNMVVEDDRLALVMDFVGGGDLQRLQRARGVLPPAEAAGLALQICLALEAIHGAGVVHRDLKPANVLLDTSTRPPTVRLADFGVARITDSSRITSRTSIVGTPSYLSPELIRGEVPVPAADIYALGATLYELLTGHPPFEGGTVLAVLHRHLEESPPQHPQIPPALWPIIEACLHKDASARPDARALANLISQAMPAVGGFSAPLPPPPAAQTADANQRTGTGERADDGSEQPGDEQDEAGMTGISIIYEMPSTFYGQVSRTPTPSGPPPSAPAAPIPHPAAFQSPIPGAPISAPIQAPIPGAPSTSRHGKPTPAAAPVPGPVPASDAAPPPTGPPTPFPAPRTAPSDETVTLPRTRLDGPNHESTPILPNGYFPPAAFASANQFGAPGTTGTGGGHGGGYSGGRSGGAAGPGDGYQTPEFTAPPPPPPPRGRRSRRTLITVIASVTAVLAVAGVAVAVSSQGSHSPSAAADPHDSTRASGGALGHPSLSATPKPSASPSPSASASASASASPSASADSSASAAPATTTANLPVTNLALDKSVSVSSVTTSAGWSAADAVDGSLSASTSGQGLGWSSKADTSASATEWIEVNLGGSYPVDEVDLYARNDSSYVGDCFPTDFSIEVSTNGSSWTTVVGESGYPKPGAGAMKFTFSTQTADYVRVVGTGLTEDQYKSYYFQLKQLEVFNP
jgi:serine/threonine-protein kinase